MSKNHIIGNAHERWKELGYDDPERIAERFRGDPWRLFYAGWTEGRVEHVLLIQRLVDALENAYKREWGISGSKHHSLEDKARDDAKAAGFKPSDE